MSNEPRQQTKIEKEQNFIKELNMLNTALDLASKGFYVFPLITRQKEPMVKEYYNVATRDPEQIRKWWTHPKTAQPLQYNIGISTNNYGDDEALVVIDVDDKGDKKGSLVLDDWKDQGYPIPLTYTQVTASGGRHLIYKVKKPIHGGRDRLGKGLDVISYHWYVVGGGSIINQKTYLHGSGPIEPCPQWIIDHCGLPTQNNVLPLVSGEIDQDRARERAKFYLLNEAPTAIEGDGGDATTVGVANSVHDRGVGPDECLQIMLEHWNVRCSPPWAAEELERKVQNAYLYAKLPIGVNAPEMQFTKIEEEVATPPEDEFDELNKNFAFVITGGKGHILWNRTDHKGKPMLDHLDMTTFHDKFAYWEKQLEKRFYPITKLWMKSPKRRSYDGIVFMPQQKAPTGYYNVWKGFAVQPLGPDEKPTKQMVESFRMFLEHALENICHNNADLFKWLMGHYAHLFQKPWEKPTVATVFRGKKGIGKNVFVESIGDMVGLGNGFYLTAEREDVVGKWRDHLENNLLFVLDEAFWSGDKQGEGVLKHLITGKTHRIEIKNVNKYSVDNLSRVCLIGNDEWVVPASHDERRFAIFDVGDARMGDTEYFEKIVNGLEAGGNRLLLDYFLKFDLSTVNVNVPPSTSGLVKQQLQSLEPFEKWWVDCLFEGGILGGEFGDEWPASIPSKYLQKSYQNYHKDKNYRSKIETNNWVGRKLKELCPSVVATKVKEYDATSYTNGYKMPQLTHAREDYEARIKGKIDW